MLAITPRHNVLTAEVVHANFATHEQCLYPNVTVAVIANADSQ